MKLIPKYLSGRSIIMNKSSIPGTSPLTSSTINYNWKLRATNNESVKKAEQERAQQAYLDRRGYISEDKDKRSYAERDRDSKIAATQNAKTDFYLMGTPNAQSTDVTPGQVLMPAFVTGTTFINPLASVAYGAMFKPMEKAGVYQPVSLGLQKLGMNEDAANMTSYFVTDLSAGLAVPVALKIGKASNSVANSNFARSVALSRNFRKGIKNATKHGDIRVPESYFHNPESVYRVTSPWERTTLQQMGLSTRAENSPIVSLVRAHDPYYVKYRKFANNPENWIVNENGEVELDWRKMLKSNLGVHKDPGHDHGVFGLNKGKTFYDSATLNTGDVILEANGVGKQFRVGHHKSYSRPVEFSENMAEANPRYSGRKQPPLALKDSDTQIPSQDFSYFERMPDGTFKYEGRIFPEKREYILGRDYNTIKSPSSSAPISSAALNFLDNGIRMLLNDLALGNTNTSFPFFKEGRDYIVRPLLQKTLDVIDEQVAPRLFKLREYIMSTPLNDRYFRGVIDQVKKRTKVSEWSPEMMDEYNRLNNESAGGWSLPNKPYIVVGRNSIRPTALTEIHEARHQIQNQINKHPNEIKVLREAYKDVPRPYNSDGSIRPGYEDYDMTPEWETMNTEARSVLLDLAGYKYNPDLSPEQNVEIQNRIIESYENGQMARTLHDDVGGYWTYYIDLFRDSNIPTETRREKIALWKKAMQLIGMGTGVIAAPKLINRE